MKNLIIGGTLVLLLAAGIIGVRLFSGSEDAWLCQNGQWIKHGNPKTPQPDTSQCQNSQAENKSPIKISGYIKDWSILNTGDVPFLHIDEIEFLSGTEAIEKGSQDTNCAKEKIAQCIPSMNNDFYIRNLDKSGKDYEVAKNASVQVLENNGSPVLIQIDIYQFIDKIRKEEGDRSFVEIQWPYHFQLENGKIISIQQQYIP